MTATFYLFDGHHTPVLNDSPLISIVRNVETDTPFSIGTNIPVRVASHWEIPQDPATLGDLLTMRSVARQNSSGFSNMVSHDLLDGTGIDWDDTQVLQNQNYNLAQYGSRGSVCVANGGKLVTSVQTLSYAPVSVYFEIDLWSITYEVESGRFSRYLTDYTNLTKTVWGGNYAAEIDAIFGTGSPILDHWGITTIPVGQQGSNFSFQVWPVVTNRLYVGSWALMY